MSCRVPLSENGSEWPFFPLLLLRGLPFVSEKDPRLGGTYRKLFQWILHGIVLTFLEIARLLSKNSGCESIHTFDSRHSHEVDTRLSLDGE
jgi:hypothetical protein